MKRKIFSALCLLLLAAGAAIYVMNRTYEPKNPIAVANVEALTDDESGNTTTYQEVEKTITIKTYSTSEPGWTFNLTLNVWFFQGTATNSWPSQYQEHTETQKFKCCREIGPLKTCSYENC